MWLAVLFFIISFVIAYKLGVSIYKKKCVSSRSLSRYRYFGVYLALWVVIPSVIIFLFSYIGSNIIIDNVVIDQKLISDSLIVRDLAHLQVIEISKEIQDGKSLSQIGIDTALSKEKLYTIATSYLFYKNIALIALFLLVFFISLFMGYLTLKRADFSHNFQRKIENFTKNVLLLFATIAILTTVGIVFSLFIETLRFFKYVSVFKFLFGTTWAPEEADFNLQNSFGIIPLITGTFLIAFIAVSVATFIGVFAAVYMSEYMSNRWRKVIKPILEILAGIPSIVYGFFAAVTFAPFLVSVFDEVFDITVSSENALTAGIVMGIMIIPLISSISDDVLRAIPNAIREGAIGVGSMKNEMIRKILLPAAMPGIMGSILLAISRAIGETMVVVMASSLAANLTLNPLHPVTTITTQIVMLVQGDQEFGSPKTLSAFALGFILLILTLILNIVAIRIVNKYKRKR